MLSKFVDDNVTLKSLYDHHPFDRSYNSWRIYVHADGDVFQYFAVGVTFTGDYPAVYWTIASLLVVIYRELMSVPSRQRRLVAVVGFFWLSIFLSVVNTL